MGVGVFCVWEREGDVGDELCGRGVWGMNCVVNGIVNTGTCVFHGCFTCV